MLNLLDYRRRVNEMYRLIRDSDDPAAAREMFRLMRDDLFRSHPQSPLTDDQKASFSGLHYYDYDPAYRVIATVDTTVEPETLEYALGEDGVMRCTRFARVNVTLPTGTGSLSLFWINGYGGGVFLPFGDATNRQTTYGAGRYLYDTIKGADLGASQREIVLDFNFAYNPSCAYNPRWVCPLAPPENRLPFPIPAGERLFP
ncbi:MAG TPA: DUF1684 domain-containing protein [Oceanobacillus sp.]|nr:DUF1684 domain-containing protein [Oceanobacillus sp.]